MALPCAECPPSESHYHCLSPLSCPGHNSPRKEEIHILGIIFGKLFYFEIASEILMKLINNLIINAGPKQSNQPCYNNFSLCFFT